MGKEVNAVPDTAVVKVTYGSVSVVPNAHPTRERKSTAIHGALFSMSLLRQRTERCPRVPWILGVHRHQDKIRHT